MVSAEHGLAWMQTRPFDSLLVIDDERMTQRVMDHPPVTMTDQEQPAVLLFSRVLLDVFRGRMDALAERFVVRIEGSGDDWQATLEPKDELLGRMIRYITVSGSLQFEEVVVQGATGDMSSIALSNVAPCDLEEGDADFGVFDIR